MTAQLYEEIENIENTILYGSPENIYGIVAFNIDGVNAHDVAKILDELKIYVYEVVITVQSLQYGIWGHTILEEQ